MVEELSADKCPLKNTEEVLGTRLYKTKPADRGKNADYRLSIHRVPIIECQPGKLLSVKVCTRASLIITYVCLFTVISLDDENSKTIQS